MVSGNLRKMKSVLASPVAYSLPVGDTRIPLNAVIGQSIVIHYNGRIHCIACGRKTNKSFSQGYCFPCMQKLARCDRCIVSPELCHYDAGTCREPDWAVDHCLQNHIVYLANSSGIKVGITRGTQVPTRWIDQGAGQALPVYQVKDRYLSGLVEIVFKEHVADRTDWRRMLKGAPELVDLKKVSEALRQACSARLDAIEQRFGEGSIRHLMDVETISINYPVNQYPEKVASINMDKTPRVEGTLMGIKGQYLILDNGVINIRKYTGYEVSVEL
ncbi:MAG TPA: DUF2797 domain-containing protein [Acidiferrobacteraceae bacterium]|nr:DUF2797 domain-containing protein [Acidiferrobacteraceae bacterium]